MIRKLELKKQAVALRKEGKTYSEILKEVPVAKSTLTLWLRDVGLAQAQKQRLTLKKLQAGIRGGEARRRQRIETQQQIYAEAHTDITEISKRELWLIGIALYWAEGSKEKEYQPGSGVQFGNSDPRMVTLFLKWLMECIGVLKHNIEIEIYIHQNSKNNLDMVKKYWSEATGFPTTSFAKVYYKRHTIKTNRKNIGDLYYGGVRVTVKASSTLVRKITGWTEAIAKVIEK